MQRCHASLLVENLNYQLDGISSGPTRHGLLWVWNQSVLSDIPCPYMGYHYHGLQGVNLIYLKINHSLRCSDKPIVPVVDVEASGTIAIAGKESTQEMPVRGLGVYLRATQWEVHFQFYKTRPR